MKKKDHKLIRKELFNLLTSTFDYIENKSLPFIYVDGIVLEESIVQYNNVYFIKRFGIFKKYSFYKTIIVDYNYFKIYDDKSLKSQKFEINAK